MSLLLPSGLNSGLLPRPMFGPEIAKLMRDRGAVAAKIEKMAKAAYPDDRRSHVAACGEMLMKHQVPTGFGYEGNKSLPRYPAQYDDPDRHRLDKAVAAQMAKLQGISRDPRSFGKVVMGEPGAAVRAVKAAGDSNLDRRVPPVYGAQQGPTISEDTIEVLNSLPDGRLKNKAWTTLLVRAPANPSDRYRWVQSVVEIINQIYSMCGDAGKPLIDSLLDRAGYDPMVQSGPPGFAPKDSDVGPTTRDVSDWRSSLKPPATDENPGPFAGSNRDYENPDLQRVARGAKRKVRRTPSPNDEVIAALKRGHAYVEKVRAEQRLAKFYNDTVKLRKRASDDDVRGRESDALMAIKASETLDPQVRKGLLSLHAMRKSKTAKQWEEIITSPGALRMLKMILQAPEHDMTNTMKGAALALFG